MLPFATTHTAAAQDSGDELYQLFEDYGKTYRGFLFKNVTAILKVTAATMKKEDRAELENVKKLYAVSWSKCTPAVQASFLADFQRKVTDWEKAQVNGESTLEDGSKSKGTITLIYKKPEGGEYIANPVFLMDLNVKNAFSEGNAKVILYMIGALPKEAAEAFAREMKPAA